MGFGITSNHERRAKDYTGAWGGIAEFKYLFDGPTSHVKRLENIIKTIHRDMLWRIDEWETEWLDNGWTPEQLLDFVLEIIQERHLRVNQIK